MPKTDPLVPILTYRAPLATPAPSVVVDVERLIASRMLIQANSGAGKSRAIRQLLEETHGRVQHLVLDPEGEFATLRERFDYVLAAPKDGDVVATPKTARLLCRRLVELGASAVLDLYDLALPDRREFVKLFLTELMALPRALWRPILVVIDEAHVFAPQAGEAQSLEAVTALCTQGRKRGFAAVLATQRIAKLHKDAAAELLNKLIGRTGLDVDVKRAGEELGFDKEQRASLKTLEPGEFFAYGPAIANAVQRVRTGPVVTSHPEAGRVSAAPPPAPERVRTVLAQLADLAQKAEEEARTIEDLERRNRELTAQVRKLERGGVERVVEKRIPDPAAIDAAVAKALKRAEYDAAQRLARQRKACLVLAGSLDIAVRGASQVAADLRRLSEEETRPAPLTPVAPTPAIGASRVPIVAPERPIVAPTPPRASSGAPSLSRGQQKILNALAELQALGIECPSRVQLGLFAGYNLTGGSGGQHIADLGAAGLVSMPGQGLVQLTPDGAAAAEAVRVPASLDELHARVLAKVPAGQRRIIEHLIGIHPESLSRAELGAAVGYNLTGGSGGQHVADLVNLGAVRIPKTGHVVASDFLFPEGLR